MIEVTWQDKHKEMAERYCHITEESGRKHLDPRAIRLRQEMRDLREQNYEGAIDNITVGYWHEHVENATRASLAAKKAINRAGKKYPQEKKV